MKEHMANNCVKLWETSTDSFCRKQKRYYCASYFLVFKKLNA
jgi:hypothetical protein